jgi:hypothetical protein
VRLRASLTDVVNQAYQVEIDTLTRRSKQGEDAYLALYQALAT